MSKNTSKVESRKKYRQLTPVVVYFGTFGIGVLSYFIARIALDAYPHPVHWASGFVGAVAGYFVGWAWYRMRGDISNRMLRTSEKEMLT
jgi:hypothetical protein